MTTLSHLECSCCGRRYEPGAANAVCECGGVLLARYDLELARRSWSREWIRNGPTSIWRYAPLLPVRQPSALTSLGEGMTPLVEATRLGERLGLPLLWIKDEGVQPTGSLRDREMACAVSMARELGRDQVALSGEAEAAVSLAAYAAAAGIRAHIFLPTAAAQAAYTECIAYGAQVVVAGRDPTSCAEALEQQAGRGGWRNLNPWREPFRLEGAKTLAFELAEQFNWRWPDLIVCPARTGAILTGIWKGVEEMEALGWVAGARPRLIAAYPDEQHPSQGALPELASRAVEASGGRVVMAHGELIEPALEMAALQGILPAVDAGACLVVLSQLVAEGDLRHNERIVVVNPAQARRHLECYARRLPQPNHGPAAKPGGLITPR